MSAEPEALLESERVRHWLEEYRRQWGENPGEERERLRTLRQFCDFVERTPDQMIDEVLDFEGGRIRLRGRRFYAEKIQEFQEGLGGDDFSRQAAGNVVRSFFIHNGLFLSTPKAPWL